MKNIWLCIVLHNMQSIPFGPLMSRLYSHFKHTFMQLCDKFVRLSMFWLNIWIGRSMIARKNQIKKLIVCLSSLAVAGPNSLDDAICWNSNLNFKSIKSALKTVVMHWMVWNLQRSLCNGPYVVVLLCHRLVVVINSSYWCIFVAVLYFMHCWSKNKLMFSPCLVRVTL